MWRSGHHNIKLGATCIFSKGIFAHKILTGEAICENVGKENCTTQTSKTSVPKSFRNKINVGVYIGSHMK